MADPRITVLCCPYAACRHLLRSADLGPDRRSRKANPIARPDYGSGWDTTPKQFPTTRSTAAVT
ncbi:hypothetical protein [Streptomyces sp. NPDC090445]|uniref:hypothetical protein n=1 Tax=Streptomyces sp. NPDC090445 TaxID=3365963 RepID=UPI0037F46D57